ncbi:uncharacterized protein DNG_00270 [Cephalotrichum gorgonifer]|uniref:Uncharacterized protein n=1 Tax=Cephalotrichum gorgonifer TaxID=2041049 RepID=A0AAE8MQI6_9PEZI|nr:uncharacterized protein DNG_00270 [Cephalotrichum gorgonifer]
MNLASVPEDVAGP